MLWECEMGMYYTKGVGWEKREQDESQDVKGRMHARVVVQG